MYVKDSNGKYILTEKDRDQKVKEDESEELVSIRVADLVKMLDFVDNVEGLVKRLGAAIPTQK